ncbi:protein phosphatase [Haloplanus rallus]|jgi:protein-tyrosine phosphatase|uniref:protein-tyrosine-phosphatase n=1 Tax=Haloplanus rallus TaxID=1816183 RepID=A0A6B9F326_9EURY|nr:MULTISPECIES: dual specificity protein phosphatase family protein [Haloplanus]QGX94658.1 protein phosphatase [Haloplanus rallus]
MHAITPHLHVGDRADARDVESMLDAGVTAVLRLTHGAPPAYPDSVTLVERPLVDGPQNDPSNVRDAVDRLTTLLDADETVLVHCSAGSSRSVAVAAAALARLNGTDVETALERLRSVHPDAEPHPALVDNARRVVE